MVSKPASSAARAIATYSGQRTTRSTSGNCTPTRRGRPDGVGLTPRIVSVVAGKRQERARSAAPVLRSRRGKPAVLVAQALAVGTSLALVLGAGRGGREPALRGSPLGEDRNRVPSRRRVANGLLYGDFARL